MSFIYLRQVIINSKVLVGLSIETLETNISNWT